MSARPTALVTGGAGFIGSHMVELLLARGYRVRVIDNLVGGREANLAAHAGNPDLAFERGDIRDLQPGGALFRDVTRVFHFAGIGDIVPSIESPLDYMSVNVQGTAQVLECARQANVRKLVYAASSSCYGLAATPTREDHPISPQYPYALSKYQGEQAVLHWHAVYKLPVNVDPHLQRLWHALAHFWRLWCGVRRIPAAEARRQALHGRRRRHPEARFRLCQRRRGRIPARRRDRAHRRNLEPRRRQSAIGQPSGRPCSAAP